MKKTVRISASSEAKLLEMMKDFFYNRNGNSYKLWENGMIEKMDMPGLIPAKFLKSYRWRKKAERWQMVEV